MATVVSKTSVKIDELLANVLVNAQVVDGYLIVTTRNGSQINAGTVGGDGTAWYSGTGAPSGSSYAIGDFYLDEASGDFYSKTGATTWVLRGNLMGPQGDPGLDGIDGADGARWYVGSGDPASGLGVINDFYIDDVNGNYWSKANSTTWQLEGNLRGPQGDPGPAGSLVPLQGNAPTGVPLGSLWYDSDDESATSSGQVAGGDLAGTYPNPTIAVGAVTTGKLVDGAVTSAKLASASVINAKIAADLSYMLHAQQIITGGGTVKMTSAGVFSWSSRFLVIANGRGSDTAPNGHFVITMPTTGTLSGTGGAADRTWSSSGVTLNANEALYYELPLGSTEVSLPGNFRVFSYSAGSNIVPPHWILIAVRGDNGIVRLGNGESFAIGGLSAPDTGWIPVTYQNGWHDYGSGWANVAYRRLNGVIYLRGLAQGGTVGGTIPIFVLPPDFRPGGDGHIPILGTGALAILKTYANGNVCMDTGNSGWVSLENVSFPVVN